MKLDDIMPGALNTIKALNLAQQDRLVIISEEETLDIGMALKEAAQNITKYIDFFVMEHFGKRDDPDNPLKLPEDIIKAFAKATCTIYAASGKPGELVSFRRPMMPLVEKHKLRHIHMIGVKRRMMKEGVLTPTDKLAAFTSKIQGLLNGCKEVKLTTNLGTDLTLNFTGEEEWLLDNGIVKPGTINNFPAGEVFTAPANVNGRMVVDGVLGDDNLRPYGIIKKTPLYLTFKDNRIEEVDCDNSKILDIMQRLIKTDEFANSIGEIGFGTNFGVKELIGNMLQDEKFPGVHLAIGDSYPEYTGVQRPSKIHCDCVIQQINAWVDGKQLLKAGKYLIEP